MEKYSLTKTYHTSVYPAIDPTNPDNSAAGKTVAISGGHSGIGYAIARGFCRAGASTIILLARRQSVLDEAAASLHAAHGTTVWTYSLDVRDTAATDATFAAIRQRLQQEHNKEEADIDILVANAAVLDQGENTLEFAGPTLRNSFDTNVFGNLNLARAFLAPEQPAVPKRGFMPGVTAVGPAKDVSGVPPPTHPKVLLEVSTASTHLLFPGQALYSTTKLASTHLLRHLQLDLDALPGRPVRVHSFHPGALLTPGVRALGVKLGDFPTDEDSLPEGFAVWLASPAAAFLKGRLAWAHWDVPELLELKGRFDEDPDFCTLTLKL